MLLLQHAQAQADATPGGRFDAVVEGLQAAATDPAGPPPGPAPDASTHTHEMAST